MSEHLSSATRIHGDANASAAWTSYCPNSKSGSSADLGHTFCASLRPHLSRPAAIRVLLPRQNQFPSQLPSHHHNCFPDNSPAWLWPLRNWTKLPNQRAKKGSGSFKIPNNSCKLAQVGFASRVANKKKNKWRDLDNSCGDGRSPPHLPTVCKLPSHFQNQPWGRPPVSRSSISLCLWACASWSLGLAADDHAWPVLLKCRLCRTSCRCFIEESAPALRASPCRLWFACIKPWPSRPRPRPRRSWPRLRPRRSWPRPRPRRSPSPPSPPSPPSASAWYWLANCKTWSNPRMDILGQKNLRIRRMLEQGQPVFNKDKVCFVVTWKCCFTWLQKTQSF